MRPSGEIRQVMIQAAQVLAEKQGGATWRDMAQWALDQRVCVGIVAVRRTVENMARAGVLAPVDTVRRPHSRRPMVRYAPRAENWATATTGSLDCVLRSWGR